MCRLFAALLLAMLLGPAQADCPPTARPPSAEQQRAGQAAAQDRGMLWRLRKGERVSYLYGTIHVGRIDWLFPGPQLRAAMGAADTLALELDPSDPAVQRVMTQAGAAPELPLALRDRLQRQAREACVAPELLAVLHPVMQAVTLTMLAGRWDGLDPAYAQELMLSAVARSRRQTVVSLESAEQQLALLVPKDAAQAVRMIEQTLQQLEGGQMRSGLARLARAWERGDLDDIAQYERWCECVTGDDDRAAFRQLNDARNPALAERIDALHAGGRSVFAAVGALHMTGAQALPLLLAQRGYQVERVRFTPM